MDLRRFPMAMICLGHVPIVLYKIKFMIGRNTATRSRKLLEKNSSHNAQLKEAFYLSFIS